MPNSNLSPSGSGPSGQRCFLLVGNQDIAYQGHTGYPLHFTGLDIRPRDLRDVQIETGGVRHRNYPPPDLGEDEWDEEAERITGIEVLDAAGNITLTWE